MGKTNNGLEKHLSFIFMYACANFLNSLLFHLYKIIVCGIRGGKHNEKISFFFFFVLCYLLGFCIGVNTAIKSH